MITRTNFNQTRGDYHKGHKGHKEHKEKISVAFVVNHFAAAKMTRNEVVEDFLKVHETRKNIGKNDTSRKDRCCSAIIEASENYSNSSLFSVIQEGSW